jgi:hypothetical protein
LSPKYSKPRGYKSIEDYAFELLMKSGTPMTSAEIAEFILKERPLNSKRPKNTVYSVLYRSKRFKLVGESLFALADTED